MLSLNGVCAGYHGIPVLKGASLEVNKGELCVIIGVNSCGKSTLLKAASGLIPITEGSVYVDGDNISTLSRVDIARKIAYLSQERSIGDMTVEEAVLCGRFPHLSYPRRYSLGDRIIAASKMEEMGITHLAKSPLSALSGGMRQNVYIATALTQCTDYLLLDEPTTFLDISHGISLMQSLRRLTDGGKGILTVMHDIPLAFNFADKIALLNNGIIECALTPRELYENGAVQRVFGAELLYSKEGEAYFYKHKK